MELRVVFYKTADGNGHYILHGSYIYPIGSRLLGKGLEVAVEAVQCHSMS